MFQKLMLKIKAIRLKKQLQALHKMTRDIDNLLDMLKYSRQQRRRFWEDFFRHRAFREDVFNKMLEERGKML